MNITSSSSEILFLIAEIFFLFILPVLLLRYKIINFKYRRFVIEILALSVLLILIFQGWTFTQLGLVTYNIIDYLPYYLMFTVFGLIALFFVAYFSKLHIIKEWWKKRHFRYLFILLSFVQELLFRSYLMTKLFRHIDSILIVVLISSILFAFIHVIYSDKIFGFVLTFIAGLGFGFMYAYFPNLILITFAHSLLNFEIMLYGFFQSENM